MKEGRIAATGPPLELKLAHGLGYVQLASLHFFCQCPVHHAALSLSLSVPNVSTLT